MLTSLPESVKNNPLLPSTFTMNKSSLVTEVKSRIAQKISRLENLISQTRESNSETKSSMGDKYETSREMVEQEIKNLQRQLNEAQAQKLAVQKLSDTTNKSVDSGALVETAMGVFYIATSVGEIGLENKKIITVSPESPLAKAMSGLSEQQDFILNGLKQTIKNIW